MSDTPVVGIALDEIARFGPIPFARFMDLCLYHPEHGYYTRGADCLGVSGDFFTASDVGPHFGACLARQVVEVDAAIGQPDPLTIVEQGGGRGLLARDVLDGLVREAPILRDRVTYRLIDTSAGMRSVSRRHAPEAEVIAPGTASRPAGAAGVGVAVELFDALPVHRVRRSGGELVELFVAAEDGRLVEVEGRPGADVAAAATRFGAVPEEGYEAEVCLGYRAPFAEWSRHLERGVVIVVDYGHDAPELYGPHHSRGTLLGYRRHRVVDDPLEAPGEQDLTAHVNFSALIEAAEAEGWRPVARTTQDRFLIANGILEVFERSGRDDVAGAKARLQAMQLIHPHTMGRRFEVLAFARGLPESGAPLAGFADPFARDR